MNVEFKPQGVSRIPLGHKLYSQHAIHVFTPDGWGISPESKAQFDPIRLAKTPNMDWLKNHCPTTALYAHGPWVGLLKETHLGSSEVGHFSISAGRKIDQKPTILSKMLENEETLRNNQVLNRMIERCRENNSDFGIGMMISDGNIHSDTSHIIPIIEYIHAQAPNVKIKFFAVLDGRDVFYQSAEDYLEELEVVLKQNNGCIVNISGRNYPKDRNKNWPRPKVWWEAAVLGKTPDFSAIIAQNDSINDPTKKVFSNSWKQFTFRDWREAINYYRINFETEYPQHLGLVDEDIPPTILVDESGSPLGLIKNCSAFLWADFRDDRSKQIAAALENRPFKEFDREIEPTWLFAGMATYDMAKKLPENILMKELEVTAEGTLIDFLHAQIDPVTKMPWYQLRLSESEKGPHVTNFLNGGRNFPHPDGTEHYMIVQSTPGLAPAYETTPEMQARTVLAPLLARSILSRFFMYSHTNVPNLDLVTHRAVWDPVIPAAEAVDYALGKAMSACWRTDDITIVVSDHGNGEGMKIEHPKRPGKICPWTGHTTNPVRFIIFDPLVLKGKLQRNYLLKPLEYGDGMSLTNVARTILELYRMDNPAIKIPDFVEAWDESLFLNK